MTRVSLVTGATGLVGNAVVGELVRAGRAVRALVRDPERAAKVLPAGVELVRGDVLDEASVAAALGNVDVVFHAAGMPEQWQADESVFGRVNRGGTRTVLGAALRARVERVVYTSTLDVFAAPPGGTLVETNVDPHPKHTAYERSKQAAEREADAVAAEGLDVVHVSPAAVYGPSPSSIGLNAFFVRMLRGDVPASPPGGTPLVFVDGIARAHVAAAERGRAGERYLVSDGHVSMHDLARRIARAAGIARVPPRAPAWLLRPFAAVSAPIARALGKAPLVAPGELAFLCWDVRVDATKAIRELGFVPTSIDEGVENTVAHFRR